MTITFIGHGYVGLVTACVFADLGNTVHVIGRDRKKIKRLQNGSPIIFEPGLEELLKKNLEARRISFGLSYKSTIPHSDAVFIAVGTPQGKDGEADLSSVFEVAEKLGRHLKDGYAVVSCKSTVPVGTNRKIIQIIQKSKPKNAKFDVASCPEFLREGSALSDTFKPDRIVIGSDSKRALALLVKLHKPLNGKVIRVGLESAEVIKYASNSILATKISFANLISFLCEKTGADVEEVLDGVGLDKRIGRVFLNPGVGFGGSCFPKDVRALIKTGEELDTDMSLLHGVDSVNLHARENFVTKVLMNASKKTIGIWGLAFKPNTDDIRDAPSIFVIEELLKSGFKIKVYDPEAMSNVKQILGRKISYKQDPYEAVSDVCALAIITEWNEFKQIDLAKVKKLMEEPLIVDGRNMYDPEQMKRLGFHYISTGRVI